MSKRSEKMAARVAAIKAKVDADPLMGTATVKVFAVRAIPAAVAQRLALAINAAIIVAADEIREMGKEPGDAQG